jgi:hypothetical protein
MSDTEHPKRDELVRHLVHVDTVGAGVDWLVAHPKLFLRVCEEAGTLWAQEWTDGAIIWRLTPPPAATYSRTSSVPIQATAKTEQVEEPG